MSYIYLYHPHPNTFNWKTMLNTYYNTSLTNQMRLYTSSHKPYKMAAPNYTYSHKTPTQTNIQHASIPRQSRGTILHKQIHKIPYKTKGPWDPNNHITTTNNGIHIKVRSHQLTDSGRKISNKPPQPCYAITHANHWADKVADLFFNPHTTPILPSYPIPNCIIRTPILSQTYGFTHNGTYIDQDTTTYIKDKYHK